MTMQSNYPVFADINGTKYKINTDFRIAIKCNDISADKNIDEVEKTYAIIFLLFGKDGLEAIKKDVNLTKIFIEKAILFLKCGQNTDEVSNEEPDMDFIQDMPYIEASFMSDYHINLEETHMHWWKFYYLIGGLSNSELGNCCILNKIRTLRKTDLKTIKDAKEREKIRKAQKYFALKKEKPQKQFTDEEIKNMEEYHRLIGK